MLNFAADFFPASETRSMEAIDWEMVSRIFASWNQLDRWLRQVEGLRRVA
jgi:hypothetical protein